MRIFRGIYLLLLYLCCSASHAGIFGPVTYEECLDDGKTGRSAAELNVKRDSCRQKFPLLKNLLAQKGKQLTCNGDQISFTFRVDGLRVTNEKDSEMWKKRNDGTFNVQDTKLLRVRHSKTNKMLRVSLSLDANWGTVVISLHDPGTGKFIEQFSASCEEL